MKHKNPWPIAIAAVIMLALSWMDTDTGALKTLSPDAIVPVLLITAIIFLVKTGILSAVCMAVKKLWDHFRK